MHLAVKIGGGGGIGMCCGRSLNYTSTHVAEHGISHDLMRFRNNCPPFLLQVSKIKNDLKCYSEALLRLHSKFKVSLNILLFCALGLF